MREPLCIKQIMPIADGFTVLSSVEDENGKTSMEDFTKDGWHYLFALVDGGEWDDDYVAIYEMDETGCGEIDGGVYRIVPKCKCPNCGLEMSPHWNYCSEKHLSYTCSCGARSDVNTA